MKINIGNNQQIDKLGVCPKCGCKKWYNKKFYGSDFVKTKKICAECGHVY